MLIKLKYQKYFIRGEIREKPFKILRKDNQTGTSASWILFGFWYWIANLQKYKISVESVLFCEKMGSDKINKISDTLTTMAMVVLQVGLLSLKHFGPHLTGFKTFGRLFG